jgi:hypothetical protein
MARRTGAKYFGLAPPCAAGRTRGRPPRVAEERRALGHRLRHPRDAAMNSSAPSPRMPQPRIAMRNQMAWWTSWVRTWRQAPFQWVVGAGRPDQTVQLELQT